MLKRITGAAAAVVLSLFLASGCGTLGGYSQKGIASWYGEEYQGRTTASGQQFDCNKKTAAHKKLPFGSVVRVKRRDNGRTTTVYVNDRGPFIKGRIIDLSKAAAQDLDMIRDGVAPVKIKVIRRPRRHNT